METSAVESPTPRFGCREHQTQGCGAFRNRCIGKRIGILLAMLNITQLVLTIIHPENSNNKF